MSKIYGKRRNTRSINSRGTSFIKKFCSQGARGALGGGNLKISNRKVHLVTYHCKSLFKWSILIKKKADMRGLVMEIQGAAEEKQSKKNHPYQENTLNFGKLGNILLIR